MPDGSKTIRPVSKNGSGWFIGGMGDSRPLYHIGAVLKAQPDEVVFICEGEKCCDAANSIGLIATTSTNGSQSPSKTNWQPLAGKNVTILPDSDGPGEKYAEQVTKILHQLTPPATVKLLNLPDLPKKGDVVDFIEARDATLPEDLKIMIELLASEVAPVQPDGVSQNIKDDTTNELQFCESRLNTVCMADVEIKPVRWLWPGRIPLGKLTILAGNPGLGKTFITMDIAARLSSGMAWPDLLEQPVPDGGVILLSAEDDPSDTLAPRLKAAVADMTKIHLIQGVRTDDGARTFSMESDILELEKLLDKHKNIRLIIIDPITAYLGKTDSHKNADVRGLLTPLSDLANRYGVSILAVNHLNKSGGSNSQYRFSGSIAFIAAARAAWLVAADKDDPQRRIMAPAKMNLAPDTTGLAYRLVDSEIPNIAKIEWEELPIQISADDLVGDDSTRQPEDGQLGEAIDWLGEVLADESVSAKEIYESAKEYGFSKRTIERAKYSIGAESKRRGFGTGSKSYWSLPRALPSHLSLAGGADDDF